MEFNNFPLKETTEALIPLTNFNPLKTIYTFNIPKNEIMVDMSVSGIDNVENLLAKEHTEGDSFTRASIIENVSISILPERSRKAPFFRYGDTRLIVLFL